MLSTATRALTELSDPQLLALQALLEGATQAEAAAAAGAGERSLRRWLHDPVFRSALHQARCDAWNTVTGRLQRAALKAVETLEALLETDHPYTRALAARAILAYAHRALDVDDLTTRAVQLEADIEAHLAAQSPPAPPGRPWGGPGDPGDPLGGGPGAPAASAPCGWAPALRVVARPPRREGRAGPPPPLPSTPPALPLLLPAFLAALRLRAAWRRGRAALGGLSRAQFARRAPRLAPALPPAR